MKYLLLVILVVTNMTAIAQSEDVQIYYNGKIFPGDAARGTIEAIAIRGDKITASGTLALVKKTVGKARLVDLKGACMLPGLIDSHNHAIDGGYSMMAANLGDTLLTAESLSQYALKALANGKGMRGDVVYIEGLHSATWNDIPSLQKVFSGASFNGRCVLLYGSDGHTAWANQALLARAGVDATFISGLPSTEQQYFGMDQGLPNGRVSEQGISYVVRVVPAAAVSSDDALLYATRHLNSLGITAWMDPATGASSEGMNNQNLETYERVSRAGTLTAHVTTTIVGDGNADAGPQIDVLKAWQQRLGQTPVKVAGFKIFSDGVMEYPTQTASMLAPYKNSGMTGSQMVDPQKYKQFVVAADRQGLLVHIHAIGDRAVTESLNAIAAARKENRNKTIPHSITHLQCVQPSDLARFKELHVLASMQLLWATADTYTEELVKPYIDPVAYAYMYPAHSILLNGGTVCGASDWPVSSANPFEAMYVAETRLGVKGVLNAKEKMSRIDMLRAYTLNAAKAILRDKEIGSLDPGKQADLIVVDRDVMTVSPAEVRGTKVLWTMVNGKLVYQR